MLQAQHHIAAESVEVVRLGLISPRNARLGFMRWLKEAFFDIIVFAFFYALFSGLLTTKDQVAIAAFVATAIAFVRGVGVSRAIRP